MKALAVSMILLAAAACTSTAPTPAATKATPKPTPVATPKTTLEFRIATATAEPNTVAMPILNDPKGKTIHAEPKPFLTGAAITEASAEQDEFNQWYVAITFDKEGGAVMKEATANNITKFMAIIVNGKVVSAPVIQGIIGEQGRITGRFTKAEAERIANGLTHSP